MINSSELKLILKVVLSAWICSQSNAGSCVAAEVFLRRRLDRRRLRRRRGRVRLGALSERRPVSGVGRTRGVLLHLSAVLQRAPVQPASRPLRPLPQSLPEQLHLPDALQWNGLLPMPSWWVNTRRRSTALMWAKPPQTIFGLDSLCCSRDYLIKKQQWREKCLYFVIIDKKLIIKIIIIGTDLKEKMEK